MWNNRTSIPTPTRISEFSSTPPPPIPGQLNFFVNRNEIFHSCAGITRLTRKRRFINYVFGGLLTIVISAMVAEGIAAHALTLPECPNGTMPLAHKCIYPFYEKCPPNMVNIHFFDRLN